MRDPTRPADVWALESLFQGRPLQVPRLSWDEPHWRMEVLMRFPGEWPGNARVIGVVLLGLYQRGDSDGPDWEDSPRP